MTELERQTLRFRAETTPNMSAPEFADLMLATSRVVETATMMPALVPESLLREFGSLRFSRSFRGADSDETRLLLVRLSYRNPFEIDWAVTISTAVGLAVLMLPKASKEARDWANSISTEVRAWLTYGDDRRDAARERNLSKRNTPNPRVTETQDAALTSEIYDRLSERMDRLEAGRDARTQHETAARTAADLVLVHSWCKSATMLDPDE